jgi:hypothetical protein
MIDLGFILFCSRNIVSLEHIYLFCVMFYSFWFGYCILDYKNTAVETD